MRKTHPCMNIILLVDYPDNQYSSIGMLAGAKYVIFKKSTIPDLLDAIEDLRSSTQPFKILNEE
jgi:hypothetical protein